MNQEKYTERMRGFLQSDQMMALREGHQRLIPDHVLKVLLDDPEGLAEDPSQRGGVQSPSTQRARGTLYPDGFRAERFLQIVDTEAVWATL